MPDDGTDRKMTTMSETTQPTTFASIARAARAIRDLRASVRNETREPLERKIGRWQRLRTPELPPRIQSVRPSDPAWPAHFERERARITSGLAGALGPGLVADVQHIGSTAIPSLASKSILDLLVAVHGSPATPEQLAALSTLGYQDYGTSPCDHEAVWLWNTERDDVAFVVHLCSAANPWIHTALNFRDYMRAFPAECARYEALKHEIAAEKDRTLFEYSLIKLKLFYEISERADAWRGASTQRPEA